MSFADIPELDYKEAVARMCGDEELYREALRMSAVQIPAIANELDAQLSGNDLANYAISVHGLKGALNTIGAAGLALTADALCKSARAEDKAAVAAGWAEFKPKLLEFASKLSEA